jgi:simple sugar transport system permease protein
VLSGASLFGFAEALRFRDAKNVPALFLVAAILAAFVMIAAVMNKRPVGATIAAAAVAIAAVAFALIEEVPNDWLAATPYIVTLLVLAGASQQLRPPAHAGQPYRPGDSH